MTLTIKIWSSSASSTSMDHRLHDVLNEHVKSSSPLPFSHWKQTWKDRYSNQHTGGQETATYIFHCLLVVSIYQLLHCNSILPVSFRQFFDSRRCLIHRAAQLSFLPLFFSRFSFLFFTFSVADIRVVGLFAVSPRVNKLSTWMSVTRSNDSAQAGMLKKMICSQGTSIGVSIVTFCDDNGYSWLSCSYLLNWTYFFLQQLRKRMCVPLAVNCGQIVLIALL